MLAIAMSITAAGAALSRVELGESIGIMQLQWIVNGFIVSFAALLLPFGSLVDRFGARPVFLSGCVLLAVATAITVCAGSFPVVMSGRVLQGIGAAQLAAAGPPALAAAISDERRRKEAFGYLGASGGIGLTLGAFVGSLVAERIGWRAAFALHLPFVVAAFALALKALCARSQQRTGRFDLLGTICSAVFIAAAMTYGISGAALGWFSAPMIATLLVALMAGWAFIAVEGRASSPLIRLSMLRNRQFVRACVVCVLFTTVWVALFIYVPLNLAAGYGRSGVDVGATMLALMVPSLVMPVLAARAVRRLRAEAVLASGFIAMAAGLAALFIAWSHYGAVYYELVGLALCGIGAGTLYGLSDYYALSAVGPERAGIAAGAFNVLRLSGDAIGSIVPAAVSLHAVRTGVSQEASVEIPRSVMNELAAGRFEAARSVHADPFVAEVIHTAAVDSFRSGMADVALALALFVVAGIVLLVVPMLNAAASRTVARQSGCCGP